MPSRLAVLALFALGSLSLGCRMCQQGYDYCGPAYEQGGVGPCQYGFLDRKGSILVGGHPPVTTPESQLQDPEPTLAPIPKTPDAEPMPANP